jgi:hypothetical protein
MPVAEGATVNIEMVGKPGPSLPLSIHGWRDRQPKSVSKADPIWDTAFTTKFSRKPAEEAPLVTPKGAAKVVHDFLNRVEEINWLAETQHQELASTLSEMKANGIDGFSLSSASDEDMETANIADLHLRKTPFAVRLPDLKVTAYQCSECAVFEEHLEDIEHEGCEGTVEPVIVSVPQYGDMVFVANMARRIEWERYIYACGPVHRVRFTQMRDGTLGIEYEGKDRDPDAILSRKRAMKARWLETHDALPAWADIANERARHAHYGKPVLAAMSAAEYDAHRRSRLFGDEDLRGKDDRGYAGPRGLLGIADDDDEPSSFWGDEDPEGSPAGSHIELSEDPLPSWLPEGA